MRRALVTILTTAVLVSLCSCGKSTSTSPTGGGASGGSSASLTFSVSPIATNAIEFVMPLGNLNPPDHTLPSDHIGFYHHLFHQGAPDLEVFAPAGGTVMTVMHGNDDKIYVASTSTYTYYLGHVILDSSIRQGMTIQAGQKLGMTSTLSYGLDLGLLNSGVTQGFIVPARYSADSLHADAPLKYFAEPLKPTLYAMVARNGADKDGQINFDQAGRLSGNWFLDSLPVSSSSQFGSGPMHLAFVRDPREPDQIRIVIGGTLAMTGLFTIPAGSIDPADVSMSSGVTEYPISSQAYGSVPGVLLVQLTANDTIRVETFPGAAPGTVSFTSSARIYRR